MNTPKSQNPEGLAAALSCSVFLCYMTPNKWAVVTDPMQAEACRVAGMFVEALIPATALADAERRAQYWKDEHLAGNAIIGDMQRRLEAAEVDAERYRFLRDSGLEISWNSQVSFSPGYDGDAHLMELAIDNAIAALLRGDGKGDGVSTDEGEG